MISDPDINFADIHSSLGGLDCLPAPSPVTLAGVLGATALQALVLPPKQTPLGVGGLSGLDETLCEPFAGGLSSNAAFAQVLKVITEFQIRLQESEATVIELHAKVDGLEEKRRLLARHTERADRDRDAAIKCCNEAEAAAKRARAAATPSIECYMAAQVLRDQLQVAGDEVARLRGEVTVCQDDLARNTPLLAREEDLEAECAGAITQLEAAHMQEMAKLQASHKDEISRLHTEHAKRIADMEALHIEQVTRTKAANAEEIHNVRTAVDSARWEAEVYVREQQDVIREISLQQRENARIVKSYNETRQEVLKLMARLKELHVAEPGSSSRQAELHAARQRYALLQKTAVEWRQALEHKRVACKAWRHRAVQRGASIPPGDKEEEDEFEPGDVGWGSSMKLSPVPSSESTMISSNNNVNSSNDFSVSLPTSLLNLDRAPRAVSPVPEAPAPSRSRPALPRGGRILEIAPSQQQAARRGRPSAEQPAAMQAITEGPRSGGAAARTPASPPRRAASPQPQQQQQQQNNAEEFLHAALRKAQLCVEADSRGAGAAARSPKASASIVEAENELEMLAFLLNDDDVAEVEVLLEFHAQRQPSPVARHIRAQLEDFASRRRQ